MLNELCKCCYDITLFRYVIMDSRLVNASITCCFHICNLVFKARKNFCLALVRSSLFKWLNNRFACCSIKHYSFLYLFFEMLKILIGTNKDIYYLDV